MSKLLVLFGNVMLCGCMASSSRTSVGSEQLPLGDDRECAGRTACSGIQCPPECTTDCGETCTVVCTDPVCGECVVTLRCEGDTCSIVSCEPLAPGQRPPAGARRVDCATLCGDRCGG
jgi:hypothetical protein